MLNIASNGHYCVPISRKQVCRMPENRMWVLSLTLNRLSTNYQPNLSMRKKLLPSSCIKQFGHPIDPDRLKKLLWDAQIADTELEEAVVRVTEKCETCARYKKARLRPVVSFDLGKDFNNVLALDLKFVNTHIVLHIIDTFSRYSQASVVWRKRKEDIVRAIMQHWVSIFGAPNSIFSDNGGEFNNYLLREV